MTTSTMHITPITGVFRWPPAWKFEVNDIGVNVGVAITKVADDRRAMVRVLPGNGSDNANHGYVGWCRTRLPDANGLAVQ